MEISMTSPASEGTVESHHGPVEVDRDHDPGEIRGEPDPRVVGQRPRGPVHPEIHYCLYQARESDEPTGRNL